MIEVEVRFREKSSASILSRQSNDIVAVNIEREAPSEVFLEV